MEVALYNEYRMKNNCQGRSWNEDAWRRPREGRLKTIWQNDNTKHILTMVVMDKWRQEEKRKKAVDEGNYELKSRINSG